MVYERAMTQATKVVDLTKKTLEIWNSPSSFIAWHRVYFSWELPPLIFLKVNFNDDVVDSNGRDRFMIQGPNLRLVVTGRIHLLELTVLRAELHAA